LLGGDTVAPSGLYARLCHAFLVILILIFLDPGTSFPGCETLSKVCGVWNGYSGDSEIVKVLDRQTALKRWIAAEIRWYRQKNRWIENLATQHALHAGLGQRSRTLAG